MSGDQPESKKHKAHKPLEMEQSNSHANPKHLKDNDGSTAADIPSAMQGNYKMYSSRWGVLLTILIFDIASNSLCTSFGVVATKAAEFYEVDVSRIDLLSEVDLSAAIPCFLAVIWVIDRIALRYKISDMSVCKYMQFSTNFFTYCPLV